MKPQEDLANLGRDVHLCSIPWGRQYDPKATEKGLQEEVQSPQEQGHGERDWIWEVGVRRTQSVLGPGHGDSLVNASVSR